MSDEKVVTFPPDAQRDAQKTAKNGGKCPICQNPTAPDYKPFCSKRCADIDLGKWLGEGYRLPSEEVPGYDDDVSDE